jgi:hypothetical protein
LEELVGAKKGTRHSHQRLAFDFLKGAQRTNTVFTLPQLAAAARWKTNTAETHISKHYRDWIERLSGARFRVRAEFARVTLEQFIGHSKQTRRAFAEYKPSVVYQQICLYEFLLPMSRETQLRAALDELFYANTLMQRFSELGRAKLEAIVPADGQESDDTYFARCLKIVSSRFGGYSISLVSGRFRVGDVCDRISAAKLNQEGAPYLIDETTASVRFIVPLSSSRTEPGQPTLLELMERMSPKEEAQMVRALFFDLFVKTVIRTVAGEEVIWLLEDSPLGRQLHEWQKAS